MLVVIVVFIFFFKQKTAYEMRISDWSSDVCSSDLYKSDDLGDPMISEEHITAFGWATPQDLDDIMSLSLRINDYLSGLFLGIGLKLVDFKIGRASCRERVCQYV